MKRRPYLWVTAFLFVAINAAQAFTGLQGHAVLADFPSLRPGNISAVEDYFHQSKRSYSWNRLIRPNRIVYIGENRVSGQETKLEMVRLMREFRKAGITHFAMGLNSDAQKKIDCYGRGECSGNDLKGILGALPEYSRHYEGMIHAANREGIRILAVDMPTPERDRIVYRASAGRFVSTSDNDPNLDSRDILEFWRIHEGALSPARRDHMAEVLRNVLQGDPGAKILFFGIAADVKLSGVPARLKDFPSASYSLALPAGNGPPSVVREAIRRAGLYSVEQRWLLPVPPQKLGFHGFIRIPASR